MKLYMAGNVIHPQLELTRKQIDSWARITTGNGIDCAENSTEYQNTTRPTK